MFQIASRDHLLVSYTTGLLVFRPFYSKGEFSGGVQAEIDHWDLLTSRYSKDPNTRAEKRKMEVASNSNRRAAFIHFDEDFFSFLKFAKREDSNVFLNQLVDNRIVELIGDKFWYNSPLSHKIFTAMQYRRSTSGLDSGIVPKFGEIESALPEIKKEARISALQEQLTGTRASSSKIGIGIVKDEEELGRYYEEIANFLKTKTPQPSKWKKRAIDLWDKAEANPS